MVWKRGRGTVQVELANLQSQVETWSEIFDGETGMIRYIQNERSERDALRGFIKTALWIGTVFVGAPAFILSVVELVKMTHGK